MGKFKNKKDYHGGTEITEEKKNQKKKKINAMVTQSTMQK